jgi:hypothetical protein
MNANNIGAINGTYQLKLTPVDAPAPPFAPLAFPKMTGSSRLALFASAHAASSNNVARNKTAVGMSFASSWIRDKAKVTLGRTGATSSFWEGEQ